jgi:hypothetical protein
MSVPEAVYTRTVEPASADPVTMTDVLLVRPSVADEPVSKAGDRTGADGVPGAVVSWTVTVNEPVAVLPAPSVAVQVTVVAPRANSDPEAGVQTGVTDPETASDAVAGVYETAAPEGPVASAVTGEGRARVGAVVSRTVTVKPADTVLPAASVAVQVTVVAPRAN